MFIVKSEHFKIFCIIILLFTLSNCQLKEPKKTHGMNFLKNRSDALTINKSNKNDIIKLIGLPHSKSVKNEDKWIYFERVITRGKLHKLGQNVLKTNNILELTFDEYGILVSKTIYDKSQMNNIEYSKQKTENTVTQKSFVNKFLSSIKQKMYGGKRK